MYKEIFKTDDHLEGPFGPSMVEPCHNLSLEELVRDYTLGIVHSERPAMYDDGEEVPTEPVELAQDFADVIPNNSSRFSMDNKDVIRERLARTGQKPSASSERNERAEASDLSKETGDGDDLGS